MKTIRRSVFETNSSSVHSLSITNENFIYPKGKILIVIPKEYGWSGPSCQTPEEKLSYLFSLIATSNGLSWLIEEEGIRVSEEEFLDFPECQQVIRAIEKHSCKLLYKKGYDGFGNIDHESSMSLQNFIIENDIEDLEDFIFNSKYEILIESDG